MSTLLITGGAGFIGSNFIHYWINKHPEDTIRNLDKLTYAGNLESLTDISSNPNYTFIRGDISNAEIVDSAMKGIDTVVHFAAESHVDRSIHDPSPFIKTNVEGTYVLLQAAIKHAVKRFHHISTDEVFGELLLDSSEKFTLKTPYAPRSPYSASKAASDHLVRAYGTTYGLPYTISNCSNNYGPFMFPEKFFPLAITNIIEGKKVPIYGDGKNIRDWLYVTDHCSAIEAILIKGSVGTTYLVGGLRDGMTNNEALKTIFDIMNVDFESNTEYVKDRPGHDRRYAIDWSKTHEELGWEPKHTFESGLRAMITWYKENQSWWKPLKHD